MTGMVPSRHSISLLVPSLNTTIHKTACMINHFLQTQQVYQTLQIPRRDDQEWIYIPIPSHSSAVNSHCYPFSFPGLSLIPISEKYPLGYSHSQTRYQNNKVVNVNSWQLCNRKAVPQKTGHHTHTRLTALCPGLPSWAGTRKVKPIWILLEQETVSGSGISWAMCKSAPRSRQITMPAPHYSSFLQAGCPSCRPTNSVKALKAPKLDINRWKIKIL